MQHPGLTREKGGILTSITGTTKSFVRVLPVNLSLDPRNSRVLNVCDFLIILVEGYFAVVNLIVDFGNTYAFGYPRVLGKIGMPYVPNQIN